jgi:Lon protease-like protein
VIGLLAELGATLDVGVVIDRDPTRASFEIATVAPVGPLDGQELLQLDDAAARLRRLDALLRDQLELLEARLSGDDDSPDG